MIHLSAYYRGQLVWTWEGPSLTRDISGCVIEDAPEWIYELRIL